MFDDYETTAIGIPNYVVDPDTEDREHQLRRRTGDFFERNANAKGGHRSANSVTFYEQCLEMAMIRIARVRRAFRGQESDIVFGYTSGFDLISHVSHGRPELQQRGYEELSEFVGKICGDRREEDELVLMSDYGLQDGLHTDEAMIASTDPPITEAFLSILDVRLAVENKLDNKIIHLSPDRAYQI